MKMYCSYILSVPVAIKVIKRLTTTTSMIPTKVIEPIYFVMRKVVQGLQFLL